MECADILKPARENLKIIPTISNLDKTVSGKEPHQGGLTATGSAPDDQWAVPECLWQHLQYAGPEVPQKAPDIALLLSGA